MLAGAPGATPSLASAGLINGPLGTGDPLTAGVANSALAPNAPTANPATASITSGIAPTSLPAGVAPGGEIGGAGSFTDETGVQGGATAGGASFVGSPSATAGAGGGSKSLSLLQDAFGANPANPVTRVAADALPYALPAAALGYQAIEGQQAPKGLNELKAQADQLGAQSQKLESYLTTGTLPPGIQQSLTTAAEQAKTAIRSQFAARGLSGSSAEAEALGNVDSTIAGQGASIATNLLNQGIQESGMTSELYRQILQTSLAQNQELGGAIANFAGALAGTGQPGSITLKAA